MEAKRELNILCPITGEAIKEPVTTPGRHTYEGDAIRRWVTLRHTSPLTQRPVQLEDLAPNYALVEAMEQGANVIEPVNEPINEPVVHTKGQELICSVEFGENSSVSVIAPDIEGVPCAVALVIDISGSMTTAVKVKHANGSEECHGLSQLDITKHGARTIVQNMRSTDYISIVSYSSNARVELPLTKMTDAGKALAVNAINNLRTEGMTNIWDGLRCGIDEVCKSDKNVHRTVMLLTDGQPNQNPPSGIMNTLKRYVERTECDVVIDTFGFGYNLDSTLLNEIAVYGNGNYAFIPDGTMVGTIFVDAISNTLTTLARNVSVHVEDNVEVVGDYPLTHTWGKSINLGTVRGGQAKTVVFRNLSPKSYIVVTYNNFSTDKFTDKLQMADNNTLGELERLNTVDAMKRAYNYGISEQFGEAENALTQCVVTRPELKKDLEGQAKESVSRRDWFNRWGKHYLLSLISAHLHCRCNNFKDGVQVYGGNQFQKVRQDAEDVFLGLPPPKPTVRGYTHTQVSTCSFSAYHDSGGVCVTGKCTVEMADGTKVQIKNLSKGDVVRTSEGKATVQCLLKTTEYIGPMVSIETKSNCLEITPWHPVRMNNTWAFPAYLDEVYKFMGTVYNLILDNGHTVFIEGIECVTLGHNFEGEVIGHNYFGSQKVINDLKKFPGWNNGFIAIPSHYTRRDKETGVINGLKA
jgi:uncharacterized protein YegL